MINDAAIREALEAIAEEAVSPERIRADLAGRTRRYRQRRIVLRAATASVAAAAVGSGGYAVHRRLQEPEDIPFPQIAGGPGGGWLRTPLRYRPGWLPRGYGQTSFEILVVDDQAPVVKRTWRRLSNPTTPSSSLVSITVGSHAAYFLDRPQDRSDAVEINRVHGTLLHDGESAVVVWQPRGAPVLAVSASGGGSTDEHRKVALQVAESLRPDSRNVWVGPRFGWLPAMLAGAPWRLVIGYAELRWNQVIMMAANDRFLQIVVGNDVHQHMLNPNDAQPVRVRGGDGWRNTSGSQLFLTLPDGVEVSMETRDVRIGDRQLIEELVRIADEMDFGPAPDMSWVGSR